MEGGAVDDMIIIIILGRYLVYVSCFSNAPHQFHPVSTEIESWAVLALRFSTR